MKKCQWCGTVELFLLNDTYCPNDCTGPEEAEASPPGLVPGNLSVVASNLPPEQSTLGGFGYKAKRATYICRELMFGTVKPGMLAELSRIHPAIRSVSVNTSHFPGAPVRRLEIQLYTGKLPDELSLGVRFHAHKIWAIGAAGGTLIYKDR